MLDLSMKRAFFSPVFPAALKYSVPVLLGYTAIGIAFGLLLVSAGYPWWLAPVMSVVMYAGAGQYIAVGLFAAGSSLWEAALVQLVINARHMAYGFSMLKRFQKAGPLRYYLIYALTDETFALLSSLPRAENGDWISGDRSRFMFCVALLNQLYWIAGSVAGALAGTLVPFDTGGTGFALTALFVVLMVDQVFPAVSGAGQDLPGQNLPGWKLPSIRRLHVFIVSAPAAVLGIFLLPDLAALLAALTVSLVAAGIIERLKKGRSGEASEC
ncbi:MAG: AzlC family ABC transporter permease [Treponema sp.]|jgi:4-azaleucine resistance transporter AzlC|nr:AzlC family ABC transporter permease [Treponema sp.]